MMSSWLAGCVGWRGRLILRSWLVLRRTGWGSGVPSCSPGPVLTGSVLQLGGHGGGHLGVVGDHGLGKVLGARVET